MLSPRDSPSLAVDVIDDQDVNLTQHGTDSAQPPTSVNDAITLAKRSAWGDTLTVITASATLTHNFTGE